MVTLDVNGQKYAVHSSLDFPLLWALREDLALRGTRSAADWCMRHLHRTR